MFKWLARPSSSVETAESLCTAKSIRGVIAQILATPAEQAIRTLSERFEDISRQRLTAPDSCRAVTQLDECAQLPLTALWESLVTDGRGQSVSDAVWHTLTTYYRKVHEAYWVCLAHCGESDPPSGQDHADAMIIASRAMTALARYMLLRRMRYRNAPADVWSHLNNLVGWVERRGNTTALMEQYPGTGIKTTIERELLVALLIEVAPTANLLPAQIYALDRLLRPYAGYCSISDTYDEQARPFAYEPPRNESPRRWLKGLPVRPGLRFFGAGRAYVELCNASEEARASGSVPQWIGCTRCTVEDYRDLLERLVTQWSLRPPQRRQRRDSCPGEILVAHDWADIRRLVTFSELARSGQSLRYDTRDIYWMTNTVFQGRSEVFRAPGEEMLANLQSFEHSLDHHATDPGRLIDSSEGGFGATTAGDRTRVKVGMLVAFRRSDSVNWHVALVRRLNTTTNHRLSIGMTKLPGKLFAARLRLGTGTVDHSRTIGRSESVIEYDALVLQDAVCTLLLPVGVVDTTWKYTLRWNNRQDIVKMEKSLDRGLNFERVEITIL
jgi:hypothetical protein